MPIKMTTKSFGVTCHLVGHSDFAYESALDAWVIVASDEYLVSAKLGHFLHLSLGDEILLPEGVFQVEPCPRHDMNSCVGAELPQELCVSVPTQGRIFYDTRASRLFEEADTLSHCGFALSVVQV